MVNFRRPASKKGISWYFRQRRMKKFFQFIAKIDKETVNILDLGGTVFFWERLGVADQKKFQIIVLNLESQPTDHTNIQSVTGDVTDFNTFPKIEFDIIFSNSVIEHLFSYDNQKKMASNIMKTAELFFVQTPNYYFPIEPHFVFPFFQYFPNNIKMYLVQHFSLGNYSKLTHENAQISIDEIKLLKTKQMKELFPTSRIVFEKFLFFNKSIIAQNLY